MVPYPRVFECDWNPSGDVLATGDTARYKADHWLINALVKEVWQVRDPEQQLEPHMKEWLLQQCRSRSTPTARECEYSSYTQTRRIIREEAQRHGIELSSKELRCRPAQTAGWHQSTYQGWMPQTRRDAQWASKPRVSWWGEGHNWSDGDGWDDVTWMTPQPPQQQRQPQQQQNRSEQRQGQVSNETWREAPWRR